MQLQRKDEDQTGRETCLGHSKALRCRRPASDTDGQPKPEQHVYMVSALLKKLNTTANAEAAAVLGERVGEEFLLGRKQRGTGGERGVVRRSSVISR